MGKILGLKLKHESITSITWLLDLCKECVPAAWKHGKVRALVTSTENRTGMYS